MMGGEEPFKISPGTAGMFEEASAADVVDDAKIPPVYDGGHRTYERAVECRTYPYGMQQRLKYKWQRQFVYRDGARKFGGHFRMVKNPGECSEAEWEFCKEPESKFKGLMGGYVEVTSKMTRKKADGVFEVFEKEHVGSASWVAPAISLGNGKRVTAFVTNRHVAEPSLEAGEQCVGQPQVLISPASDCTPRVRAEEKDAPLVQRMARAFKPTPGVDEAFARSGMRGADFSPVQKGAASGVGGGGPEDSATPPATKHAQFVSKTGALQKLFSSEEKEEKEQTEGEQPERVQPEKEKPEYPASRKSLGMAEGAPSSKRLRVADLEGETPGVEREETGLGSPRKQLEGTGEEPVLQSWSQEEEEDETEEAENEMKEEEETQKGEGASRELESGQRASKKKKAKLHQREGRKLADLPDLQFGTVEYHEGDAVGDLYERNVPHVPYAGKAPLKGQTVVLMGYAAGVTKEMYKKLYDTSADDEHAAEQSRLMNNEVFTPQVLSLSPGKVRGEDEEGRICVIDPTTSGGNSGSEVFLLKQVYQTVALHRGWAYQGYNHAILTSHPGYFNAYVRCALPLWEKFDWEKQTVDVLETRLVNLWKYLKAHRDQWEGFQVNKIVDSFLVKTQKYVKRAPGYHGEVQNLIQELGAKKAQAAGLKFMGM